MYTKINRNKTENNQYATPRGGIFDQSENSRISKYSNWTHGVGEEIEFEEVIEVDARTITPDVSTSDVDNRKEFVHYAVHVLSTRLVLPVVGVVLIAWGIASALRYLSAFPEFWWAVLAIVLLSTLVAVVRITTVKEERPDDLPGWKGSRKSKEVTITNNITIKNEIQ
jgi:hypothetical protein